MARHENGELKIKGLIKERIATLTGEDNTNYSLLLDALYKASETEALNEASLVVIFKFGVKFILEENSPMETKNQDAKQKSLTSATHTRSCWFR